MSSLMLWQPPFDLRSVYEALLLLSFLRKKNKKNYKAVLQEPK